MISSVPQNIPQHTAYEFLAHFPGARVQTVTPLSYSEPPKLLYYVNNFPCPYQRPTFHIRSQNHPYVVYCSS